MTNATAEWTIGRAAQSLRTMRYALDNRDLENAVTEAQQVVELSIQAAILAVGRSPGRGHDSEGMLPDPGIRRRVPSGVRSEFDEWLEILDDLAALRLASRYGPADSEPASMAMLSDRSEVERRVRDATRVFDGVRQQFFPGRRHRAPGRRA